MLNRALQSHRVGEGEVLSFAHETWRLAISTGPAGRYRLAQLDEYTALPRSRFPRRPPLRFSLRARASAPDLPGTWGFGLWNDPFSMSLGFGGGGRKLPAPPNAAWFFFASRPNYLSLRDDLPAHGRLAAVFSSPGWSAWLAPFAVPSLPLLAVPALARWLRRQARKIIHQAGCVLEVDETYWHAYTIEWDVGHVRFILDGSIVFESTLSPAPPLGVVIWIDNQYAAFTPHGRLSYGTLPNPTAAWIEVQDIQIHPG